MQNNNIPQSSPPMQASPASGSSPTPKPQREGWRGVLSTLALLILAPLIALFLTSFVFQSYEVDGPSMETSLQHRDRLIVLKTGRTWARITGGTFIPKRGDIVIFNKSGLQEFGSIGKKQLIKRVVALPGERVVVKDGNLTVYNRQYPDGFSPDKTSDYGHVIMTTSGDVDVTVRAGQVFVMGDNRSNSLDSRNFGAIPTSDIVGTLSLRIFPLNKLEAY
jgi:signal peptidase I